MTIMFKKTNSENLIRLINGEEIMSAGKTGQNINCKKKKKKNKEKRRNETGIGLSLQVD